MGILGVNDSKQHRYQSWHITLQTIVQLLLGCLFMERTQNPLGLSHAVSSIQARLGHHLALLTNTYLVGALPVQTWELIFWSKRPIVSRVGHRL